MKIYKNIPDKWLYLTILILGAYFVYRLINQSQMIFQFPLETTNDYGAHMAQLFLLAKYGFHQIVPQWYNGFKLFLLYPPGWYFITLPFYLLSKNILATTFISVIVMFLANLVTLYIFGKNERLSLTKRVSFFLLLFANSIAIGNYIRLGRVSEHLALTCFLILAVTIFYFRKRRFDWRFFVPFIPFYALIIISHPSTAIIFHVLLFCLFLIKGFKEKIILVLASLISIALSSFWWIPFLKGLTPDLIRADFAVASRILEFSGAWALTSLASFLVIMILGLSFYFYWKSMNYSKKEFKFFLPILILGFLFVTRLIIFIPLLKKVYPDIYMFFFLFFSIYFLFKTKISRFNKVVKAVILIGLIILPLASVSVSEIHTIKFTEYTKLEKDTLELIPLVKGSLIMPILYKKTSHPPMYYAYGTIYHNLTTPVGVNNFGTATSAYFKKLSEFKPALQGKDCIKFIQLMNTMNVTDVISYNNHCKTLDLCGFEKVKIIDKVCLYYLREGGGD